MSSAFVFSLLFVLISSVFCQTPPDLSGYTNKWNFAQVTLYAKPVKSGDSIISLALVGPASQWLSVGWQKPGLYSMDGIDAVVGWNIGTQATIYNYTLEIGVAPVGPGNNDLGVHLSVGEIVGSTQYLLFTRTIKSGKWPITPGQNYIFLAQGNGIPITSGSKMQPPGGPSAGVNAVFL